MIRHGQASFGKVNYDKLSQKGIIQSRILGQHFAAMGVQFDEIYSGSLLRQRETLTEFCSFYKKSGFSLPAPAVLDEFNEHKTEKVLSKIIPELLVEQPQLQSDLDNILDKKSFQRVFESAMQRWVTGNYQDKQINKWEDFLNDVDRGINLIMQKKGAEKNIALFTSGGPIAAAVKKAIGLSDENVLNIEWQIVNSSVTRFKFTQKRIMISVFNDHSHLETESHGDLVTYR